MKKLLFLSVLCVVFFFACNENKVEDSDIIVDSNVSNIYSYPYQDNSLVIVRISSGKKIGRWPSQICEGNQRKICWLWFPKDQIINNPNEFYEDYACIFYDGAIKYYQPRYNEITGEEMYTYNLLANQGFLEITDEMVVSDNFVLNELDLNSSFIILPGRYYCDVTSTGCVVTLDVRFVDIEEVACFFMDYGLNDYHYYSSSSWRYYVNEFEGLKSSQFPLGILSLDESNNLIADFYAVQQSEIGLAFMNLLHNEGRFHLSTAKTINDPNILEVLNVDTFSIETGYYDLDISEFPDKLQVNFGLFEF